MEDKSALNTSQTQSRTQVEQQSTKTTQGGDLQETSMSRNDVHQGIDDSLIQDGRPPDNLQYIQRLEQESQHLKSLLSNLHQYVTTARDAKGSSFYLPSEMQTDSPVTSESQQVSEILQQFKDMEGYIQGLGQESQHLKSLLSNLHQYVTTARDAKGSSFYLPSEMQTDSPVTSESQQVSQILQKFKEMEGANAIGKGDKTAKKDIKKLRKMVEEQKKKIECLEDQKEIERKNLEIQKDTNRKIDEQWKSDYDMLQNMKGRLKVTEKDLEANRQREANIVAEYKKELSEWNLQSKTQSQLISELEKKRDDLLNRLSKLAGDRFTHENTNITDLSDADRPTKLSEIYFELYDNEWTDAFEELTSRLGFENRKAITKLLDILLTSFHRCREITWQRYHTLKAVASTIDIVQKISSCVGTVHEETKISSPEPEVNSEKQEIQTPFSQYETEIKEVEAKKGAETMDWEPSEGQKGEELTVKHLTGTLTIDQEKQIKTLWRTTTNDLKNEAVKHLNTVLLTELDIPIKDWPNTSKYLASCIDLCWKMGIQEKPMHLDVFAEKDDSCGKPFDVEKFRAYTKSGNKVAFVVWPVLFLYEGGPMLVKGIAQGCKETDN